MATEDVVLLNEPLLCDLQAARVTLRELNRRGIRDDFRDTSKQCRPQQFRPRLSHIVDRDHYTYGTHR